MKLPAIVIFALITIMLRIIVEADWPNGVVVNSESISVNVEPLQQSIPADLPVIVVITIKNNYEKPITLYHSYPGAINISFTPPSGVGYIAGPRIEYPGEKIELDKSESVKYYFPMERLMLLEAGKYRIGYRYFIQDLSARDPQYFGVRGEVQINKSDDSVGLEKREEYTVKLLKSAIIPENQLGYILTQIDSATAAKESMILHEKGKLASYDLLSSASIPSFHRILDTKKLCDVSMSGGPETLRLGLKALANRGEDVPLWMIEDLVGSVDTEKAEVLLDHFLEKGNVNNVASIRLFLDSKSDDVRRKARQVIVAIKAEESQRDHNPDNFDKE